LIFQDNTHDRFSKAVFLYEQTGGRLDGFKDQLFQMVRLIHIFLTRIGFP